MNPQSKSTKRFYNKNHEQNFIEFLKNIYIFVSQNITNHMNDSQFLL